MVAPIQQLSVAGCTACHKIAGQLVGPGFEEIRAKYAGQHRNTYLVDKIVNGGSGVWGPVPMPAISGLTDIQIEKIVSWLASGDKKERIE